MSSMQASSTNERLPKTTYFDSVHTDNNGDINKWQAYPIYDVISQKQMLAKIYQGLFGTEGRLPASIINLNLDQENQEFEFEWSRIGIDNIITFKKIESFILDKANENKISLNSTEQIYLNISRTIDSTTTSRIVVTGQDEIKSVLSKLENLDELNKNVSALKKQRLFVTPRQELQHLNLRCRVSIETQILDLSNEIYETLRDKRALNFRLIKRRSLFFPGNIPFKIDLSVVKQGNQIEQMLNSPEIYEAELEFNPKTLKSLSHLSDAVVNGLSYFVSPYTLTDLNETMVKWDLYLNFSNDDNFSRERNPSLSKIWDKWFENIPNWDKLTDLRDLQTTVVNFESKHLGQIYKSNSYAVTDKSDGVRNWLFINSVGDVFLINVNMEIKLLKPRIGAFKSTILDGEYVKTEKGEVFLIFDCLIINGDSVMSLPLLTFGQKTSSGAKVYGRLERPELGTLSDYLNTIGIFNEIKQFQPLVQVPGENEMKGFLRKREIIQNTMQTEKPYETDGVIFTLFQPNYYQMVGKNGGIYWDQSNIKWKPANQLSVDFLVTIQRDFNGNYTLKEEEDKTYKVLELSVAKGRELVVYSTILWPINTERELRCLENGQLNGDAIYDGSVIECLYGYELEGFNTKSDVFGLDSSKELNQLSVAQESISSNLKDLLKTEWIPIRLRDEKTRYKRPNSYETVKTIKKFSGLSRPEALLIDYSAYQPLVNSFIFQAQNPVVYKTRDFRGRRAITEVYKSSHYRSLLNLNQLVKFNSFRQLVDRYKTASGINQLNVMELASGPANDWDSWTCLANVYGVDIDVKSISDANNLKANPNGIFKNHLQTSGFKLEFQVLDILDWENPKFKSLIDSLPMMDIITCQFAFHFFTGKEADFNQFVSLVKTKLKPGGALLMSIFDGKKIENLLQRQVAVGLTGENNELLWQISKPPGASLDATNQIFGDQILSTIVPLTDYHANLEYLIKLEDRAGNLGINSLFRENGLILVETRPFLDFLIPEQIDYFRKSQHSANREKLSKIINEVSEATKYDNLKTIANYHSVVVYVNGPNNLKSMAESSLFSGLKPDSPNVLIGCQNKVTLENDTDQNSRTITTKGRGRGRGRT